VQARPDAFRPDLAGSLNNLSNQLSDLGRREEALAAVEEAVTLHQYLYGRYPAVFARPLTQSLALTGYILRGSGSTARLLRALLLALTIAAEHQLRDLGSLVVSLLRAERQEDPRRFDALWQEVTGGPVPDRL